MVMSWVVATVDLKAAHLVVKWDENLVGSLADNWVDSVDAWWVGLKAAPRVHLMAASKVV